MNSDYSGKKWIVFIQEEMNSVYSDEESNSVYSDEEMNSAFSGKKWIKIVIIQRKKE